MRITVARYPGILAALLMWGNTFSQGLEGLIRDGEIGEAIAFTHITIYETGNGTSSNENGKFLVSPRLE